MAREWALITPSVLKWARESAGLTVEEAAKKASVKPAQVASWEDGHLQPTMGQARRLGEIYKRPLAVFYLPEPPKAFAVMKDFRRVAEFAGESTSPALRLAYRRAELWRSVALDLAKETGEPLKQVTLRARPDAGAEATAKALRLVLIKDSGPRPPDDRSTFNWWRAAIERLAILVFQASGVEVSEARGFSTAATLFPTITLNVKDSYYGRTFTLLHELCHIALRDAGVCDLHDGGRSGSDRVETFCNHVAGATLVPRDALLASRAVARHRAGRRWAPEELEDLSHTFGASREVVLRRLLILDRATEDEYKAFRKAALQVARRPKQKQKGGPSPDQRSLVNHGYAYARLVVTAYQESRITASAASDLLGVRLKHMPAIAMNIAKNAGVYG